MLQNKVQEAKVNFKDGMYFQDFIYNVTIKLGYYVKFYIFVFCFNFDFKKLVLRVINLMVFILFIFFLYKLFFK